VARGVPRPRYGLSPMLDPEAEPTRPAVALPLRGNEREAGGARAEPAGAEPGIPSRTAAGSAGG